MKAFASRPPSVPGPLSPDYRTRSAPQWPEPQYKFMGVLPIPTPGVSDYQRNSWRWNDPSALSYDLDRAQESRDEAAALHGAASLIDVTDLGRHLGPKSAATALLARLLPWQVTAGATLLNQGAEYEQINREKEIAQLKARLKDLGADPSP